MGPALFKFAKEVKLLTLVVYRVGIACSSIFFSSIPTASLWSWSINQNTRLENGLEQQNELWNLKKMSLLCSYIAIYTNPLIVSPVLHWAAITHSASEVFKVKGYMHI